MIEETPLDLGHGLTGVLTRPAQPTRRPLWVLLNAGFIPRSGPFRMHVDLARALAAQGFAVLRVDQPGVGDAPPKRGDDVAVIMRGRGASSTAKILFVYHGQVPLRVRCVS